MGFWGTIHCVACVLLLFYLGSLARSCGRSFMYGLLGPGYWGLIGLMVWSLAGADTPILGVVGGVMGAVCAYIVVDALDSAEALEAEARLKVETLDDK